MNSEQFIKYVVENKNKKHCLICNSWVTNEQETYKLCCFENATLITTLIHLQNEAENILKAKQ